MAELVPVPLQVLLRRARVELDRTQAIFDLPFRKFYRGPGATAAPPPGLDLSVAYAGARAANPVGPAAGPHTQLAQNLALCWLGGARILELKTVQLNDALTLSRPCIDMATVGYNTEWSQELPLDASLREYVKASMLIQCLEAWDVLANGGGPSGFLFDVSVGYDLAGIRSTALVRWLETIRRADALVEDLRADIPPGFAALRDLPFRTCVSTSVTLSTFHGTPADEIERIGEFLIGELGFHTVVKLNPPMLGRDRIEHLLHDVLGYREIEVNPACYERSLGFEEAVAMIGRLQGLARQRGVEVGVKCGNTLEVLNRGTFLKEPVQYLSGQPLFALHAALAQRWRAAFGDHLLISFSGGIDAGNAADAVAAGLVPVTACTDLLRAGGYGRLSRYLATLEQRMRVCGATTIDEFITRTAGAAGDTSRHSCVQANTDALVRRAVSDPRYHADQNRKAPRKLGTRLWLWDCVSCSKCVPACPNDAVFELDAEPFIGEVPTIAVTRTGWQETGRALYWAKKPTQIAIYADACNDCGNCDVFCPEHGGPHLEKPRIFGSLAAWRRAAPLTGFVLTREEGRDVLRGRFADGERTLRRSSRADTAEYEADGARLLIDWTSHQVLDATVKAPAEAGAHESTQHSYFKSPHVRSDGPSPSDPLPSPSDPSSSSSDRRQSWDPALAGSRQASAAPVTVTVDVAHYLTLRILMDALLRPSRIHFVNVPLMESSGG